jgi:outer membrane protein assembly factor BamB
MRTGSTGLRARTLPSLLGLLAAAALVATLAGCGGGGRDPPQASAAAAVADWGAPNADATNTRRVGGPIEARSVARLRVAWTVPLNALYTATPVVVGGVAYTQDMQSDVSAIDVASGRLRWKHVFGSADTGPNGVAVAGNRVYGATLTHAFALDTTSGRQLWSTNLARVPGEQIDMAPGASGGLVYVSTVPGNHEVVGTLWALDGASGRRVWKWEEVPASLWGHPDVNAGGGAWHPPAFDKRGGLYIGLGNPVAWPGTAEAPWGRSRPGDNRWDNSIVKLNARTGKLLWAKQVIPHDVYDWDLECPVILATAGGRRLALAGGKMGFVYAFDAETGALVWKRSVGLHNGHDGDNLRAMRGDYSRLRRGQRILPGDWGGIETPMASDGTTVYVPVNNLYVIFHNGIDQPEQQDLMQGTGEIVALDVATGRVRWDRKLPHSVYGAATVSNDVVFTTTFDGTVWGMRTDTGAVVWRSRLPAGTDAPVAIAGDTLLTGASLPLERRQHPAIVAYRLGDGAS